ALLIKSPWRWTQRCGCRTRGKAPLDEASDDGRFKIWRQRYGPPTSGAGRMERRAHARRSVVDDRGLERRHLSFGWRFVAGRRPRPRARGEASAPGRKAIAARLTT